jgi:hypothetical protein
MECGDAKGIFWTLQIETSYGLMWWLNWIYVAARAAGMGKSTVRYKRKWWARRDSNPQPSGYEPPALTIELQALAAACGAVQRRNGSPVRFGSNAICQRSQAIAAIASQSNGKREG